MFDLIAADFPRLISALRRTYRISREEAAAMILAARYPGRAAIWTAENCRNARAMIGGAFAGRLRTLRGAF